MRAKLVGDFKRLLEIEKELLAKLLVTVKSIYALLSEDDMDGFSREMDRCGEIMSMVDELEKSANGLKQQMPDLLQHPDIVRRKSEILVIAHQIEQARRECNDLAEQKLELFGRQVRAIRRTKKGIDGYANQFQGRDAIFIDAKK